MAIYGVGAYYSDQGDVSGGFIAQKIVGSGWPQANAPELFQYFKAMKVGDIAYIKAAFGGGDITVKAIGLITDDVIRTAADTNDLVAIGRNVIWLSTTPMVIPKPAEKNNVRSNTVYEEFHPEVQAKLMATIGAAIT